MLFQGVTISPPAPPDVVPLGLDSCCPGLLPSHATPGPCSRSTISSALAAKFFRTMSPTAPQPPFVIAEKFHVESILGRGGMGVVYRARQEPLRRNVAIKMILGEFNEDDEFRARFRQEAITVAALTHPGIVQIYDVVSHDGNMCIVMEFVQGRTLDALMRERRLDPRRCLDLGARICEPLSFCHRRGIVHRDIKPENVMLMEGDAVKVMDFGIAKASESTVRTQTGTSLGTPKYMSPEQAQGFRNLDARSDMYSLGCVLYEMLTGRVPFEGEQSLAVAIAHVREMPTPPRLFNQSIHPEVEHLVLRCLEKDPNHRYRDMEELGRELRRLAALPNLDGKTPAPAADEFTAVMSSDAMQKRLAEAVGVVTTAGGASMPASTHWEQRARYEYEPAPAPTPLPTAPPAPTGRPNPATQHPYGAQQASDPAPGVPAGRGAVTVFEAPRRSLLLPVVSLLLLLALGGVGVVALLNPSLVHEVRTLIGLAGPAPTATPTLVATSAPTPVPTVVATATPTAVPTATPAPPPTATPVATATATPAPTATATPAPSPTPDPPTRDRAAEAAIEERFNRHAAGLAELNLSYDDLKDHPSVRLALRILQEGRESMPESPRVQHLLGTFYITLGRFDEAREVLQMLTSNPLADPAERDFAERLVFTLTPND